MRGTGPRLLERELAVRRRHATDRGPRPRLPVALERELVLAAKAQDADARAALIEAFLPLVASVARLYRGSAAVDRAELMQEGVVGLLRALERFDPSLHTPFWAYASWWVRQAMQQLVSELTRPVVLSDRAVRQLARVKDAHQRHLRAHSAEPTLRDLAESTGLSREQVERLMAAERKPRALEEPLGSDGEAGGTFGDLLADPNAEDAYECVPRRLEVQTLPGLLSGLNERERTIVGARYGLDGPEQTLGELAGRLGVSAERVRQIEQRALDKLRDAAG
jgi:DNA-directed RNA polymerase sigma subunit (sigma70/sigma32)